jgi:hypothetical protein
VNVELILAPNFYGRHNNSLRFPFICLTDLNRA